MRKTAFHPMDDWLAQAFDWFRVMCHQDPTRSLHVAGRQLPLCLRCSGIYAGLLATLVVLALWRGRRLCAYPSGRWLLAALALTAAAAIDGATYATEWRLLVQPDGGIAPLDNALRALTGLATGVGLGMILYPALTALLFRAPPAAPADPPRRRRGSRAGGEN